VAGISRAKGPSHVETLRFIVSLLVSFVVSHVVSLDPLLAVVAARLALAL
jgi:hypothetical protein